jgi:hypothetical protein
MARKASLAIALLVLLVAAVIIVVPEGRLYAAEVATRAQEKATNAPTAKLTELTSIDQLKDAFNSAGGQARLILLFSPT